MRYNLRYYDMQITGTLIDNIDDGDFFPVSVFSVKFTITIFRTPHMGQYR